MALRNNIRGGGTCGACVTSACTNGLAGGKKSRRAKSRRGKTCRKRRCHKGGGMLENLGKVVVPAALSYALFKVGRKTRKRRKSKKSK